MRYEDVSDLNVTVAQRIGFKEGVATRFHFRHAGRRYSISRDNLPEGVFDELRSLLAGRVAGASQSRMAP
jgi:hypothetical protein